MHPYLTRLNVKSVVQQFLDGHLNSTEQGDLVFPYGDADEHFGFAFHQVPVSARFWHAGNAHFSQVRQVIIASSAMEATAWLNNNYSSFGSLDNLLILATGTRICLEHIRFINERLSGRMFGLLFGRDLLGHIADLKIAAGIRRIPVAVYCLDHKIKVVFRSAVYEFPEAAFSLAAFEKASRFRFKIPAYKPKGFDSFFDQLKANAGLIL